MLKFLILSFLLVACGAKNSGPTRPSAGTIKEIEASLVKDDGDAVYRLLSRQQKKNVSREEFRKQWTEMAKERESLAAELSKIGQGGSVVVSSNATAQLDWGKGRLMELHMIDGLWSLSSSLLSNSTASTPRRAVQAFASSISNVPLAPMIGLLSETRRKDIGLELTFFVEGLLANKDKFPIYLGESWAELQFTYSNRGYRVLIRKENAGWFIHDIYRTFVTSEENETLMDWLESK